MAEHGNDLWRDFPKTAIEFDERFQTEEDCRAYWMAARWGGKPACAKCQIHFRCAMDDARLGDELGIEVKDLITLVAEALDRRT